MLPGPIEASIAATTGQLAPLAMKPAYTLMRNRLPSAVAAGSLGLVKNPATAAKYAEMIATALSPALQDEKYGPVIARELRERGPDAALAMDLALHENDPDYAKRKAAAMRHGGGP